MNKLSLTTEQLEEIKQTSFNNGMASNQWHNKASKETLLMFNGLKELFENQFKNIETILETHDKKNDNDNSRIIEQTTKTNGRVTKLEDETLPKLKNELYGQINPIRDWKNKLLWAWAVLSIIVVGILVPLTLNYLKSIDKTEELNKKITQISEVLNNAEIINE